MSKILVASPPPPSGAPPRDGGGRRLDLIMLTSQPDRCSAVLAAARPGPRGCPSRTDPRHVGFRAGGHTQDLSARIAGEAIQRRTGPDRGRRQQDPRGFHCAQAVPMPRLTATRWASGHMGSLAVAPARCGNPKYARTRKGAFADLQGGRRARGRRLAAKRAFNDRLRAQASAREESRARWTYGSDRQRLAISCAPSCRRRKRAG